MPDTTLTGLDAGITPDGTELMYVVQSGNSRRLTALQIANAADAWATVAQGALADSAVQPGDLATVATTGAYADLSGLPTLGTAAATAATDYATAAQGATADTAVQPNTTTTLTGLTVTTTFDAPAGSITRADLANSTALSIIGRSANSAGAPADIAAGTDHQVLRRSGTALGFGAVALNQAAAVTGALPVANGGTGGTTAATARTGLELGSAATATVVTNASDVTAGRLLTTESGAGQAYRRGNILGVVAASAGVPTAALIEQNSNANGSYVRFADGTQICWFLLTTTISVTTAFFGAFRSGGVVWTFPAVFSADPSTLVAADNQTSFGAVTTNAGSTTGVQIAWTSVATSASASRSARVFAVGRWF